ncbi:MAG: sialidase family protein [Zavarzinella sp.]
MAGRFYVATRKGLFTITSGMQGRWNIENVSFAADNVGLVMFDPRDGMLYVSLEHSHFGTKVHRSLDGGNTWQEIATPSYPPKPEGEVDLDPWRQTPREWKLEKIWAFAPGHSSQPSTIWCGTLPGGLFRSDDSGASWQLVESLWNHPLRKSWSGGGMDQPGIHSICLNPANELELAVAVSCGGVWKTNDAGASWYCDGTGMYAEYMPPDKREDPVAQDPHLMVRCAAQPDHLWVQHHNGIFYSQDNARTWEVQGLDKVPSTFGFAVAVHPTDPGTAWFVPGIKDEKRIPVDAKLAVTRTRDGGKSFDTLTSGLPQEHAYDVVYRHALAIDAAGQELMFGSTTGNVWASNNQGNDWQPVCSPLPPVYAVVAG